MPGGIHHIQKEEIIFNIRPSPIYTPGHSTVLMVRIKVLPVLAEEPLGPTVASHCTVHHLGNLHSVRLCVSSPKLLAHSMFK